MKYLDQLRNYVARGYTLTPLKSGSKEPIYKEWQARPTNLAEFHPDLNVGLVLGTASGGLVDIDLDHPASIKAAPCLLPRHDLRLRQGLDAELPSPLSRPCAGQDASAQGLR